MHDLDKFLALLNSPDETNIEVALEMAKGVPALQSRVKYHLQLYVQLFGKRGKKKRHSKY